MRMKEIMLMYAMAGMMGGGMQRSRKEGEEEQEWIKRKAQARAATLSKQWNGQQLLHKYTINGVEIEATDKLTARKIYNRKYKNA